MSFEALIERVSNFGEITDFDIELIKENFKIEHFKKNELLITSYEECNKIFFNLDGILRLYHSNESSTEVTRSFIFENNFCTNIISFSGQDINKENIQALEDTTVLSITNVDFYKMLQKSTVLMTLYVKILETAFKESLDQFEFLNTLSERQRIEKCFNDFPEITSRVKDKIIATYIGVSPEFFSRVKSDLLKKR
ncbi:MAG: Crp/Fnr family transcriptional regulator [Limnohabitans sp.]|nr:Crp/Fnr family transcriptional regulator [Limnohabitans sp.]